MRVLQGICFCVALAALIAIGAELGGAARRIANGELTAALWLSELGERLRGKQANDNGAKKPSEEIPDKGPDESSGQQSDGPTAQDPSSDELYTYDFSSVPEGARAVVPVNICQGLVRSDEPSWQAPIKSAAADEPLVLIVHSHGGEGYTPQGTAYLAADAAVGRASEQDQSVIAVGEALKEALEKQGVRALHVTERFDADGNAGAFARAGARVEQLLAEYISIVCVIDVHRAAGLDASGNVVRPVAWYEGQATAQISLLAAQDSGRSLALAKALAYTVNGNDALLCQEPSTVGMDAAWTSQERYCLRAEIGASGNSPKEAAQAAKALALALADRLK